MHGIPMMSAFKAYAVAGAAAVALAGGAAGHVPYLEREDIPAGEPFAVADVDQSIAVYAWLESAEDVDVYAFEVVEPVRVFAEVLVPVCPCYREFRPGFALVGPGLPAPTNALPVALPAGCGAIMAADEPCGTPRERFYEPFGGKSYFNGPGIDMQAAATGTWFLVYWDPAGEEGDYVAVIGAREDFGPDDIGRALVNTAVIRRHGELHGCCRRFLKRFHSLLAP